ncbi:MAG: patatin family protein [Halanaerobiales bacterium]|nr:patatin family protein [Halanaerobiales bacterium]
MVFILKDIGLVLEGGGMRGAYTAGVLDVFLAKNLVFPYVIGVSAGANNGANFVARQFGRSKRIFIDHSQDNRYMGINNFLKDKSYFGMDFIFDTLPQKIDPFAYNVFYELPTTFKVVLTDCNKGKAEYISKKNYNPEFFVNKILRASSSLPLISKPVKVKDNKYLDGGIADPIPIKKAIDDGYRNNVLVLTREKNFRKSKPKTNLIFELLLRKYPKVVKKLKQRHKHYNQRLEYINKLEREGKVFVFRPQNKVEINRLEQDQENLRNLYKRGYCETLSDIDNFKNWYETIKNRDKVRINYGKKLVN